ncbi:MAG: hypothetical protein ABSA97_02145 [Verrucomicrobiia bacterium]
MDTTRLREVWQRLHEFCSARDWRGCDPYDGLNSRLFQATPLADSKFFRQAWTQFHRRSPINFRPLCGIKPTLNPKGLALFAIGSGDLKLLDLLEQLRTKDGGWGYPFDWQSRAFFAPRGTPNLICTAFAARAFRELGRACDVSFIEKHLLLERDGERWITYIGSSDTQVHNVNMIGAALLGRRDCMEFSVRRQRPDGSWWYGEASNQHWIDNYHTGFNLVALKEYETATGDTDFADAARRGFGFWDRTFWTAEFAPRHYHNSDYPFDVHCTAQGILTYLAFGNLDKANCVARWALQNMWDERGFFWYQRGRRSANRICYMRWTQAWMYCALAKLIKANETANR